MIPTTSLSPFGLRSYGAAGAGISRLFFATRRFTRSQSARDAAYRELMSSQWWTRERLEDDQWSRLTAMLQYAYEYVPYYRRVFQELRAEPSDIKSPADFAQLPVITKEILQQERAQLRSTGPVVGVYENHTGGSTGTPLTFYQDANYFAWGMAELDRNYSMCGYRAGWRQAFLWGSDYDSRAHRGVGGFIHDLILNLRWYNTFQLNVASVHRIVEELNAFRPHLIVGYVSALTTVAIIAKERGLRLHSPRAIQTSAEVLTQDARALLEDAFQTKCYDRYGCREVGNIAHECEAHDGLHLLMESNFVEFRGIAGSTTSELIVTNLRNRAMPFIRYATGDTGRPASGPCSCGRGLARMESLGGRVSDVIVSPSGKLIHGEFFTHLFYGADGIRQFQVEQTTVNELIIRVAASSETAFAQVRDRVSRLILTHGDPAFRLEWRNVDAIDASASGKHRFTLSRVPLGAARKPHDALAV